MIAAAGWVTSWGLTFLLAVLGFNSASSTFIDLIRLIEGLLEMFAWPIILILGYVYAARLRKWRDQ